MLESIVLSEKTYGWYVFLQWDNNWCNPDFSTCCKKKEDALALMLEKAKNDSRTKGYDLDALPIIERGLTKRAPDKWDSAASQAFSTPQPFSTPEMNLVPPTCG